MQHIQFGLNCVIMSDNTFRSRDLDLSTQNNYKLLRLNRKKNSFLVNLTKSNYILDNIYVTASESITKKQLHTIKLTPAINVTSLISSSPLNKNHFANTINIVSKT